MNILYVGVPSGTSLHRATALRRLGHDVQIWNPLQLIDTLPGRPIFDRLCYRLGYRPLQPFIWREIRRRADIRSVPFDVVWVNSGEFLGARAVRLLCRLGRRITLYVNDDPTGPRDKSRWTGFLGSIPEYDLCAVVREPNVSEFRARGAKNVLRVFMSYDEVDHRPLDADERAEPRFDSEVVFVGTWMPERGPFMARLLEKGVPLSIWGDRWEKSGEWPQLSKGCWKGRAIYGRDYIRAITQAKICLGLLSKGNRDLHTQRSAEVPYAGALFCAERTREHLQLYRDGVDAALWSDADECAEICHRLLRDPAKQDEMRRSGRRRVGSLKLGNEDICGKILLQLDADEKKRE